MAPQSRLFKTRWFARWARKQSLDDHSLCQAVTELAQGLYEADLGGGLFKKRVARTGGGKSGGYRTLIATNQGDRWFFVFAFEKSQRSNINQRELTALKALAQKFLRFSEVELEQLIQLEELQEIHCDA